MSSIRWVDFIADEDHCECGVIGEGHHVLTPGQFLTALRTLNAMPGYSASELMDAWRTTGRISHQWEGDDPSGEYSGLVCDETGDSGVTHYCDGPCRIHAEPEQCDDAGWADCRCEKPWCPGDGQPLVATNLKPVTVVQVDWDRWGRIVDARLRKTLEKRLAKSRSEGASK